MKKKIKRSYSATFEGKDIIPKEDKIVPRETETYYFGQPNKKDK